MHHLSAFNTLMRMHLMHRMDSISLTPVLVFIIKRERRNASLTDVFKPTLKRSNVETQLHESTFA